MANQLDSDGKAALVEAAGKSNGGNAGEIGGAIEAEKECASGVIFSVNSRGLFTDARSSDGSGGGDESVDACRNCYCHD